MLLPPPLTTCLLLFSPRPYLLAPGYRSRGMKKAFDTLEKAMILTQLRATSSCHLHLLAKEKRPKRQGSAEIDFCLIKNGRFFGLEVKSGADSQSKSAGRFLAEVNPSSLTRLYSGPGQVGYWQHQPVVSWPFYLAPALPSLL